MNPSAPPHSPLATEIRCQEKSKGGLRYEVILAESCIPQAPEPKSVQQTAAPKTSSAEEIAEKLKAAEDRRLVSNFAYLLTQQLWIKTKKSLLKNLEAKKIADWNAKAAKIEEATRKKDELNNEFKTQTKEALKSKMGNSEEKREAIISDLKEKLKVIKIWSS
jgi:stathmin